MIAINYATARKNLKEYCDKVVTDFETVIITRECGESVVLISESTYNNMLENLYVRSNAKDYCELIESIRQIKKGRAKAWSLMRKTPIS